MNRIASILAVSSVAGLAYTAVPLQGAVVAEYNAATAGAGVEPNEISPAWYQEGTPMVNNGTYLLQNNTADDPATTYGRYATPAQPGLLARNASGKYGIEFTVRPLTDIPFLSSSHYANLMVAWKVNTGGANPQFAIHIDKDTDDGGAGTTGSIAYGQDSFFNNDINNIDWSVPHTVFVGYDGSVGDFFSFYIDGTFVNNIGAASMARADGGFGTDTVSFGDTTTGQGVDQAAEWYMVRLHDTATPPVPEPTSIAALALVGGIALLKRRRA